MFRNEELRHLRLAQFFRYFKHQEDEKTAKKKEKAPAMRTDEDTLNEEDEGAIETTSATEIMICSAVAKVVKTR